MTKYALIVAGGSGSRMKSSTPKQFLLLGDKPILMHTAEAFQQEDSRTEIIIVLPEAEIKEWQNLVRQYNFTVEHRIVAGGATRFVSVKNGLNGISGTTGLVAIHDGVRPLVTSKLIRNCFKAAASSSSGVAAVMPKDSIREVTPDGNRSVNRDNYQLMQTPQTFEVNQIKAAYGAAEDTLASDDATIAERFGMPITLVEGEYSNLKITTPEDITIAQALLNERNN